MPLLRLPAISVCSGLVFFLCAASSSAQGTAQLPSLTGKVAGVETKGRTTTLTVTDDGGNEHEFALTPKVELEIVAVGDDGFLTEGQMVQIDAVESNESFFGTTFSVYPHYSGRPVPAKAVKAPPSAGQSQNRHFVSGEIVRLDDKGDGKYHLLQLKLNPKSQLAVYVEPTHQVRVILTDPSAIKEGQEVRVTGRQTGQRLTPTKITIVTGETLKGAEFLPTIEKKR